MDRDFVFATYVVELKKALTRHKATETVISNLYGLVAIPACLDGKGGLTIDCAKSTGHDIVHRIANPHQNICAHSHDPVVIDGIASSFKAKFSNDIHPSKLPTLVDTLAEIVEESDLHESIKKTLLDLVCPNDPWLFLGRAYLESLQPTNKLPKEAERNGEPQYPKRPETLVPSTPSYSEGSFIDALMEVYEEDEGVEGFSLDDLEGHPKSQKHFQRQRGHFYAAEAVRRGTRDIFSNSEEDQFEVLKEEVYDGIDDLYFSEYETGLARLTQVVSTAGLIPVQRSWLGRDTDWISPAEKKGVCHFLVNDGRLDGWVNKDE